MAAAPETAKPTSALGGRSNTFDYAFPASYASTTTTRSSPKRNKLKLVTSASSSSFSKPTKTSFGDVSSAGASPASSTSRFFPPRSDSRTTGATTMSSPHITSIPATGGRTHAKLHKRGGSGSSIPNPSMSQSISTEDAFPPPTTTSSTSSIPKLRPYLRKMSTKDSDSEQGRLDLSKSLSENEAFTGLGIHDLSNNNNRSASDVSFTHTTKRPHARTTSGDSTSSNSALRPTQPKPFVHPMRQTPRPYTPPHPHRSFDSTTLNDEERSESSDVVGLDEDFRLGGQNGYRSRRSVSISSTPVIAPTPLSQSHTAFEDLGGVPKITGNSFANVSLTNLSIKSNKSGKSAKSRPSNGGGGGRSRRNTERSVETPPTTASARTSFDKAFSFASGGGGAGGRRSDTDPLTREERIQAARRKFEAREERKAERRRDTEEEKRRKSEASERTRLGKKKSGTTSSSTVRTVESNPPAAVLPIKGAAAAGGWSEKSAQQGVQTRKVGEKGGKGGGGFGTWVKSRLLGCGGKG